MLVRLDHENRLFSDLEVQWRKECDEHGESLDDFATPMMSHAAAIASEQPSDTKYGIYALQRGGSFDALLHANKARLPATQGETLRILWILLAPRYDFENVSVDVVAALAADLITGAEALASETFGCEHLKIHLTGVGDREFFTGLAQGMSQRVKTVAVRGNWFHLTR